MLVKKFSDDERFILRVGETVEAYRDHTWRMMRVEGGIVSDENGYDRCPVTDVDPKSPYYGRAGAIFPGEIRECVR